MIADTMSHPQPPATPLNVDTTVVGLANDTLRIKCSKCIDMWFQWLRNCAHPREIRVIHIPCTMQLAIYLATLYLHIIIGYIGPNNPDNCILYTCIHYQENHT